MDQAPALAALDPLALEQRGQIGHRRLLLSQGLGRQRPETPTQRRQLQLKRRSTTVAHPSRIDLGLGGCTMQLGDVRLAR